MTPRKSAFRTICAGVVAFVLAMAAVTVLVGHFVREDIRTEMAATRQNVSGEIRYNYRDFMLRYFAALAVREVEREMLNKPENATSEYLEQMQRDYDVDYLGIRRVSGETVAECGGGTNLVRASYAFHDDVHVLEMGMDIVRFSRGAIGSLLLADLCKNWPSTSDGFPLCISDESGVVTSSGYSGAQDTDTIDTVFEDPALIRTVAPRTFFKTRVYGRRSVCTLDRDLGHTFVVAVPVDAISHYRNRPLFSLMIVLFVLVGAFTVVMLRRAVLLQRLKYYIDGEKSRMKEDLSAANLVQLSALPPPFPRTPSFSVYARMDPARVVGGDFYDYQMLPNGCFYFLIADVSGKGISAAMFMMRAKSVIKQCLAETRSLPEGMTQANALLAAQNDSKLFVTAWVGVLEPRTGRVQYVNAGHNPPLVRRKNGATDLEWVTCPPSLVMALMPGVRYPVHELTLQPGDSLVLYTDGVTEAQNAYGKLYGEKRLEKVVRESGAEIVAAIRADLDAFQGTAEPADDVTLVAIDYGGTPPGTARGFPCGAETGLAESSLFVESELKRLDCPPAIRTKFLLAYDEVASNVVNYSGARSFTVKVAFEATPPAFTLTLTDSGKAFNPLDKAAPDLSLPLERRTTGGYGIFITRQMMDDVIYSRDEDRNVLTLRKKLQPQGQGG